MVLGPSNNCIYIRSHRDAGCALLHGAADTAEARWQHLHPAHCAAGLDGKLGGSPTYGNYQKILKIPMVKFLYEIISEHR